MERLTKRSKATTHENGVCCTHFLSTECCAVDGNCASGCKWEESAWERLAAYEDTGVTPEEVNDAIVYAKLLTKAQLVSAFGVAAERLYELAEADRDGRVVVLPCKVGDTVYLIVTKRARTYTPEFRFVKKSRLTFFNMERILQDFGKAAFPTREEAEKALEAMENG